MCEQRSSGETFLDAQARLCNKYHNLMNWLKYLIEHNADVNALTDNNNECLGLPAEKGYYQLVEYLI